MLSMKKTGADVICTELIRAGATTVFGYPGGAILPLYDALARHKKIKHILVRHEQGAGFAAQGFARASGRKQAGVCIATSGPGATNLVTAIADAAMDSIPLVAITGQVAAPAIGTDAFQETDILGITMPITKYSFSVTHPKHIVPAMRAAFMLATHGRPGPVVVDISKDAQAAAAETAHKPYTLPGLKKMPRLTKAMVSKTARIIRSAKRPAIIVGAGVHASGAYSALSQFLKKTGIPAVTTLHGQSALSSGEKGYLGMLGMHGTLAANYAVHEADVVIGCGIRFDDRITGKVDAFAPKAQFVHIDIDASEKNKVVAPVVFLQSDVGTALEALYKEVPKGSYTSWHKEIAEKVEQKNAGLAKFRKSSAQKGSLTGGAIVEAFSRAASRDSFIVTDVGQHQMWFSQCYPFPVPGRQMTSGGLGTMGFALPAAMGAKVHSPKAPVWCITGDGGFQMNMQELGTLMQEGIGVKILLMNNGYLGMVRQWQELFHKKNYSHVALTNPHFVQLAKAYGIPAERVTSAPALTKAIKKAEKVKGPYLIDVAFTQEENIFPMVPPGTSLGSCVAEK